MFLKILKVVNTYFRKYIVGMLILLPVLGWSQDEDVKMIRNIYDEALKNGKAYGWLDHLCKHYPSRIGGSDIYVRAANHMKDVVNGIPSVSGILQDCETEYWYRGSKEEAYIVAPSGKNVPIQVLALGGSIATPEKGITAQVIEVQTLEEVEKLGRSNIEGKIVFFNRPMDATKIRTFHAYGGAVDQRVHGPSKAAEYGAVACIVRSMTTLTDEYPHTGVTVYKNKDTQIPALAVSTLDANRISDYLKTGSVTAYVKTDCQSLGMRYAPSVIGEIKGSEFPDEIILVGGHLDSWDVCEGAHDDGAGCVQSVEVLRILTSIGYRPKRTLRCVLFSNEENGSAGGRTYADVSNANNEFHMAAIESDAGGFTPRGFRFEADTSVFKKYYKKVNEWLPLLESYDLQFYTGGSGADVSHLRSQKGLLIGLAPDSQRYFDIHHSAKDGIENVNQRELELGAAAMASLVYLLDNYGIK